MDYELRIQDPTHPSPVYLIESIAQACDGASDGGGIFAFASKKAVESFLEDDDVATFLDRGTFHLIVGIDAITNRATLERLQEYAEQIPNLTVRVFWNPRRGGLFHPKIVRFLREDGSGTALVGSGNLTPGGLGENFEAYSVITTRPGEPLEMPESLSDKGR